MSDDPPAYQRRFFAWWELRGFLAKRLSYDDFGFLLAELRPTLNRWLWDDPSPLMAFDAKPKPRVIEMVTELAAAVAHGKFDGKTNNEIEKFCSRILDIDKEDTADTAAFFMREAYNALMAEGLIDRNMTITKRHEHVLNRLGKKEDDRGYRYENFRANVVKS